MNMGARSSPRAFRVPALDQALAARLEALPNEESARQVFADALLERNHPWGRLIALQTARDASADAFLIAHATELLGDLAGHQFDSHGQSRLGWHGGFIERAAFGFSVAHQALDDAPDLRHDWLDVEACLGALLDCAASAFLKELIVTLRPGPDTQTETFERSIAALARRQPVFLEALTMLGQWHGRLGDRRLVRIGPLDDLMAALPRLELLELQGRDTAFRVPPAHDTLQALSLHGGLAPRSLDQLMRAELPRCSSMSVGLAGARVTAEVLQPLLAAKGFASLTSLELFDAVFDDSVVPAVARSPLAKQLNRLVLHGLDDHARERSSRLTEQFAHIGSVVLD